MKRIILAAVLLLSVQCFAQISDSVQLGAGYGSESYYSFNNGEMANVDNSNWDLAFDLSGFGAAIRFNRRIDVLYLYPGTTADWATLDTTGISSWDQYIDGYDNWSEGALNAPADIANPADLGWGVYNSVTHFTDGNRLFVIELGSGVFKKLFVEQLASGVYTFKHANLDNSDEVDKTITKSSYSDLNFIYYVLESDQTVNREPASSGWDIVFTNYVLELGPGYFGGVTSVLHNLGLSTSEVTGVPSASAVAGTYDDMISTIGYDWKSYDFATGSYLIEDSNTYFVEIASGEVWKLVFTGFNGSIDGKIFFTKELVEGTALREETTLNQVKMYPNPAAERINFTSDELIKKIEIHGVNGQLVSSTENINQEARIEISTQELNDGFYLVRILTSENKLNIKKLIVKH
ncbi:MAG: T9SS type A sorting domain-containing protein [Flavobacteriales bacterium]|nr:T9SS type A sorting domain-containing protein [Flavobacteriales bacterium]